MPTSGILVECTHRVPLALPQVALAVIFFAREEPVVTALLIADLLIVFAPWPVPRETRSWWSYWAETALYLLPLVGLAIYAISLQPAWLTHSGGLVALGLAAAIGGMTLFASRLPIRALVNGDLAALRSYGRPSHAAARATQNVLAAPLEEIAFRGLFWIALLDPAIAILGTVVFVLRHYLVRGTPPFRVSGELFSKLSFAIAAGLLAQASNSIWPAVLLHAIVNLPGTVMELQQVRPGKRSRERN